MSRLEVVGLTKDFGGLRAVGGVSFDVGEGQIKAIIGPNGAGKSTVFNLISGVFRPTAGQVRFGGRRIDGLLPHQICRLGIGRTFQLTQPFVGSTVLENVMVGRHCRTRWGLLGCGLGWPAAREEERRIRADSLEILRFLGLGGKAGYLAGELPAGEQRLLEIGRALATEPKLLLLDEAAAGLSRFEKEILIRSLYQIRDRGVTLLLVEHDMGLVMKVSEEVVVLNYGRKIAEGTPAQVQRHEQVLAAYLGGASSAQSQ